MIILITIIVSFIVSATVSYVMMQFHIKQTIKMYDRYVDETRNKAIDFVKDTLGKNSSQD